MCVSLFWSPSCISEGTEPQLSRIFSGRSKNSETNKQNNNRIKRIFRDFCVRMGGWLCGAGCEPPDMEDFIGKHEDSPCPLGCAIVVTLHPFCAAQQPRRAHKSISVPFGVVDLVPVGGCFCRCVAAQGIQRTRACTSISWQSAGRRIRRKLLEGL
jgi:hypothetical protein